MARPSAPPASTVTESAKAAWDALGRAEPRVGIVLGSGLGGFADTLDRPRAVPTASLPGFPASTVPGHRGRLVAGRVGSVPVIVLQGRVHGYEGYGLGGITHGVRVIAAMGIRGLVLTNAAGAMCTSLSPGDLMLVRDHVHLGFMSRAVPDDLEERVPRGRGGLGSGRDPLSGGIYSDRVRQHARAAALDLGLNLREGVLVYGRGPSYETAAEVRLYRWVGGHAACMSTVPEAIAGRVLGLEVTAISCISNLGTGLSPEPLTHDEVTRIANEVSGSFRRLLTELVVRAYGSD